MPPTPTRCLLCSPFTLLSSAPHKAKQKTAIIHTVYTVAVASTILYCQVSGSRLCVACGTAAALLCSALLCSALLCSDADADADAVVKVLMFYVPQTVAADINDQCHGPYNLCLCLTVDKNKRI